MGPKSGIISRATSPTLSATMAIQKTVILHHALFTAFKVRHTPNRVTHCAASWWTFSLQLRKNYLL